MQTPARGFTVIETLVALGIVVAMILMLAVLVRLQTLQQTARAEEIALTIATQEMESLRVGGYASLPTSGSFADSALASLTNGSGSVTVSTYDAKTKQVEVQVSWTSRDGTSRTIRLSTLITQTGGLL